MTLILILAFFLLAVAVAVMRGPGPAVPRLDSRAPIAPDSMREPESPAELALADPVEALLRYGTPADAARLADQGIDLAALGYRPPGAE
jgi:hypothetical protein